MKSTTLLIKQTPMTVTTALYLREFETRSELQWIMNLPVSKEVKGNNKRN